MPTTTQQSFFPIHPTLTNPHNKKTTFPQTSIQSTVKPAVVPQNSQMDYETSRTITKSTILFLQKDK